MRNFVMFIVGCFFTIGYGSLLTILPRVVAEMVGVFSIMIITGYTLCIILKSIYENWGKTK